ncbi:MAG: pyruvate dehydrogenase (acetyl-transferring) E1 component subunit alpha [Porticoccaceae bacterium]|nr:pyruvate dehydrogenase (acetyl-transferring) E1 component subunit alpha [Porticoccaceae bacterium]
MHTVAEFSIGYRGYLNSQGVLGDDAPSASSAPELLVRAYGAMVLARIFDAKAIALQRTGQMGTYASCLGQEAIGAAIGLAMAEDDLFVPYYRDQATQLLRGVSMTEILQYWGGDERGSNFARQRRDLPNCVPIATQITHAAGAASAFKLRKLRQAVVVTCGDGATSRGDFYESINLAGAWQLPLVVVVNNNQWAISVRRQYQSGAATLAQKAIAAGIPGEQVDGNDFIAVHAAVSEALQRAYDGKGATLIEAICYRLSDHTTADDATRYRPAEELKQAWQQEPIKRLQTYLHQCGLWSAEREQGLQAEVQEAVAKAVAAYQQLPPAVPESLFEYVFAEWPAAYAWQRDMLRHRVARMAEPSDSLESGIEGHHSKGTSHE